MPAVPVGRARVWQRTRRGVPSSRRRRPASGTIRITKRSHRGRAVRSTRAGAQDAISTPRLSESRRRRGRARAKKEMVARYRLPGVGAGGIVRYDRGGGSTMDLAGELRKASQAARGLEKYLPAFHAVLFGYPQATLPTMRQNFYWAKYNIQGKPT